MIRKLIALFILWLTCSTAWASPDNPIHASTCGKYAICYESQIAPLVHDLASEGAICKVYGHWIDGNKCKVCGQSAINSWRVCAGPPCDNGWKEAYEAQKVKIMQHAKDGMVCDIYGHWWGEYRYLCFGLDGLPCRIEHKCRLCGSTLTVYKNGAGAPSITEIDTDITTGYPGARLQNTYTNLDDWIGSAP